MTFTLTTLNTPFGLAMFATRETTSGTLAVLLDEPNPHAAIYAAKLHGVTRVIEVISALRVDPLLEAGDMLIPDGLVDLTSGRRSTFFVNRGYGFVGQDPVWCPQMRDVLIAAAQSIAPRVFTRGILAVGEDETSTEDARIWNADALSASAAPATYLAKELELCYAVVTVIGQAATQRGNALIAALTDKLPDERLCNCAHTMRPARERGLIGDDWRTWIGDIHADNAS